jgi:hypothetical protein
MRAYLDIHPVTPLVCATLSFLLHYIIAVICGAGRTFLARSNLGFPANIFFRRNSRFVSTFLVASRRFSVILGVSRWCSAGLVLVSAPRLQHCFPWPPGRALPSSGALDRSSCLSPAPRPLLSIRRCSGPLLSSFPGPRAPLSIRRCSGPLLSYPGPPAAPFPPAMLWTPPPVLLWCSGGSLVPASRSPTPLGRSLNIRRLSSSPMRLFSDSGLGFSIAWRSRRS